MVRYRNFLPLVVAALIGATILGSPTRAYAGFRVTINATGGGVQYYYSAGTTVAGTTTASFGSFTDGNFSATIQTTSTNNPGTSVIGSLSQTVILGAVTGTGGNFDALVEIVSGSLSIATAANGQVTNAGDIATLLAASQTPFTLPQGTPNPFSSDVSASTNATVTSGSAFNTTTIVANAVTSSVNSLTTNLNPAQAERIQFSTFANPLNSYTMSDHLFITGINAGAVGPAITSSAGVQAVPAPAGLLLLASAAPVFVLGWLRRRKTQSPAA